MRKRWRLPGARWRSFSASATGRGWPGCRPTWPTSCTARTASTRRWTWTASACAALEEHGEPRDVAVTLQNMATCQIGMNDFRGALETYQRARAYCIDHELPLLLAVADYNIAYLYYLRGEYTRAIARLRRRARALPQAGGCLSRSAVRPGPVRNVRGAEPQRGRGANGAARHCRFPQARQPVRGGESDDEPGHCRQPSRQFLGRAGAVPEGARAVHAGRQPRLDGHYRPIPGAGVLPGAAADGSAAAGRKRGRVFRPQLVSGQGHSVRVAAGADSPGVRTRRTGPRNLPGGDREAGAGGEPGAELPGAFRTRADRRGAGRERGGTRGLRDGPPRNGEPAQPSARRRNQDCLPQRQARGIRGAGAHVPGRGRRGGGPGDGIPLHRASQIPQPGGPDRVPGAPVAGPGLRAWRTGGTGARLARGAELVQPRHAVRSRPRRQPARRPPGETAAEGARVRAPAGGADRHLEGGRPGVRYPSGGGRD